MKLINSSKNMLNGIKNNIKKTAFSTNAKRNFNLNEKFDQFPIQEKHKIWYVGSEKNVYK